MKIDLHVHTQGSDGISSLADIVKYAKLGGVDGVALCDHHTNTEEDNPEAHRVAAALAGEGIAAFIGVEYSTAQGHLLIFGVDVPSMAWGLYPEMQAVIDEVAALGGACVVPHPYKGYRYALGNGLADIHGLCGVETANGQCALKGDDVNYRAREAAERLGLAQTGGSDAHWAQAIGLTYTVFPGAVRDDHDLVDALRAGGFYPEEDKRRLAISRAIRTAKMGVLV